METIAQKQLAFLEETANHYNLNNRCSTATGCRYSPESLGLKGKSEGCAIGRKLTPTLAKKLDREGGTVSYIFEELPEELKALGRGFLMHIQLLHDNYSNWDREGLSEIGERTVESIKKQFEL